MMRLLQLDTTSITTFIGIFVYRLAMVLVLLSPIASVIASTSSSLPTTFGREFHHHRQSDDAQKEPSSISASLLEERMAAFEGRLYIYHFDGYASHNFRRVGCVDSTGRYVVPSFPGAMAGSDCARFRFYYHRGEILLLRLDRNERYLYTPTIPRHTHISPYNILPSDQLRAGAEGTLTTTGPAKCGLRLGRLECRAAPLRRQDQWGVHATRQGWIGWVAWWPRRAQGWSWKIDAAAHHHRSDHAREPEGNIYVGDLDFVPKFGQAFAADLFRIRFEPLPHETILT